MSRYSGPVNAPEFPAGLDWLNTSEPLSIRSLRGKIILLEFWTFCCINCHHNLAPLRAFAMNFPVSWWSLACTRRISVREADREHPGSGDAPRYFLPGRERCRFAYLGRVYRARLAYAHRHRSSRASVSKFEGEIDLAEVAGELRTMIAEFDARGELDRTATSFRSRRSANRSAC